MSLKVNKIIKYLVLSDLAFWTGWGLINPVFAIFVLERVEGGSAFVVGMAAAVFWVVKSILRIPIGMLLDKHPTDKDDYFTLVAGLFVSALVPFGFLFAKTPLQIYILQAIHGIGLAMSLSGWTAIFTRNIDKGKESTEWGLDATSIGLGTGLAGAVGGWAVSQFGFDVVLIVVGSLSLLGVIILFGLRNHIRGVFDHGLRFSIKDVFDGIKK